MATQKEFNKYYISISSLPLTATSSKNTAYISLHKDSTFLGSLQFVTDYPIPANIVTASTFTLYYHVNMFEAITNMLRYEKPLFVTYDSANKSGWIGTGISTGYEGIGEQEGV